MSDFRVSFPKPCSERWDAMRSDGRNRFCERCEKTIHDLSQLTLDETRDLARSAGGICVRAKVGPNDIVDLRSNRIRNGRRMVATIGASVGILATSGQAAAAKSPELGAIKGEAIGTCGGTVSAIAADGQVYHAKIGLNGRYKVKRLPAGRYVVRIDSTGPEPTKAETVDPAPPAEPSSNQVMVEAGRTVTLDVSDSDNQCIVIGMLEIDDGKALS